MFRNSKFKSENRWYFRGDRFILFSIPLLLFFNSVSGQTLIHDSDYANNPAWIKMIDDPGVNYYTAMKAYTEYWKHHLKPAGEEEEMAEGGKDSNERERDVKREIKKDRKKIITAEDLKLQNENNLMKYHVKRFEQWAREVKPFVQEDGRILTSKERIEIWNKQQEELKNQQK